MASTSFEQTTPNLTVVLLGHIHHGKTTLAAACSAVAGLRTGSKVSSYADIDGASEKRDDGNTVNVRRVDFEQTARRYTLLDFPSHADIVESLVPGSEQAHGAILVVAADSGTGPQTHEHIQLARQVGIQHLVVFLNKVDVVNPELIELVEIEVVDLLNACGYPADSPIIKGSAYKALIEAADGTVDKACQSIAELGDTLDSSFPYFPPS
ncbi:GTP-binding protein [Streptomyces sp. CB00316]|uniref:GTP-binding protein n=1 Tax=Streptomyces sp. CB00316 TaxID=1703932 RepID=UPI00093E5630|nr:GTP-binding protein [Streptomyces sp. CB00316]